MKQDARFSDDDVYRYCLSRVWDKSKPYVLFIGFNPSTADGEIDDKTTLRCIEYAEMWGYGGLRMANLFAYVSSKPDELKKVSKPIGIENNGEIEKLLKGAGITVVAWGNLVEELPSYKDRYKEVLKLIKEPMCIKITQKGQPYHPLGKRGDKIIKCSEPKPYHYE
jgi:hypothetical protein